MIVGFPLTGDQTLEAAQKAVEKYLTKQEPVATTFFGCSIVVDPNLPDNTVELRGLKLDFSLNCNLDWQKEFRKQVLALRRGLQSA